MSVVQGDLIGMLCHIFYSMVQRDWIIGSLFHKLLSHFLGSMCSKLHNGEGQSFIFLIFSTVTLTQR